MMGESPQRPGSFQARPLVVVVPEISPFSFSAEQWMVPVGGNKTLRMAAMRCFGLDADIGSHLLHALDPALELVGVRRRRQPLMPVRTGQSRPPPVGMSFLPQQPDLAGMFGQQIFARKTLGDCKTLRAFTHQHHVAGVLHHGLGDQRNVLDIPNAPDRAGAAGRTVHAAGIELHNAFFIGQPTQSDAVFVGIVFRSLYNLQSGIERVAAIFQEGEGVVEIVEIRSRR